MQCIAEKLKCIAEKARCIAETMKCIAKNVPKCIAEKVQKCIELMEPQRPEKQIQGHEVHATAMHSRCRLSRFFWG